MVAIHRQTGIGIGTLMVSMLLILFLIPNWVSSPSNVPNVILSPLFWPYTLAGITALIGLGLIVDGLKSPEVSEPQRPGLPGGGMRLASMAIVMVIYILGVPRLGMVWTSMVVFAATAFIVRTSHPKTALLCAIVIPLLLYAFFAHVAGVAIPQGQFVRLP